MTNGTSTAAESKKPKKPKWDVNAPPGPSYDVAINVDEGTWISLDVHPSGKKLVFDLLGDLYELPIEGGEAKPLTEGMAWDMQPRYSPNGERLVFTSDRGGGDNAWIMPSTGGATVAVTKESFRLVNSPVWTPDGDYIAVRKHFTSRRSLGAGEIWLYHRNGGKGLMMTKRPNDQKDLGEPAFSPDGRYLYFSQDVTPGARFEYNKDPHKGIYAIKRLDLETRHTQVLIGGPGGAVRPTPSPDGKTLAFVGRKGLKTALFLFDLQSGERTLLYDELDRDMQETWAIHGVYPAMDWTPDGRALVFWSGGKIMRLDVRTRNTSEIPFRIKAKRKVLEALRSDVEVHPERFHTKMLRWPTVAPGGRAVVFQTLGQLYTRRLPQGTPRRLTRAQDHFEFYPSYSTDGRRIVYSTWSDKKLGTIRLVSASGGSGRVISREPGHYVEPVFSPDGRYVVYRKVPSRALRAQRWGLNPGLYAISVEGRAPPKLLSRSGWAPRFGARNDRVYFMDSVKDGKDSKVVLKSVGMDGQEVQTHLKGTLTTDFKPSPDGKLVAFNEGFRAYVMPFPRTGQIVDVGPKVESLPVKQVSEDAGAYMHWSSDSASLHWSLGPKLYTESVNLSEKRKKDPGVDIGFSVETEKPSGRYALVGAKIITMKGEEVFEEGVVVIENHRILSVGPKRDWSPGSVRTVDVSGKTIVPGFVDVHAHGPQAPDQLTPQQNWHHLAYLAFGVSTIHDPSHNTAAIFSSAELQRAGKILAPRIFSTGTILYGAKASFKANVESLEDARFHLRRMKAVGAISVKSYNQPRRDQRQQVLTAARELNMMVVPEGGSLFQHNMNMVVDGHTGIEHAVPIAKGYADMIQLWSQTEVGYTPTIVVGYGGVWGENYWYQHTEVFENERLRSFVPSFVLEPRSRRRMMVSEGDWNHIEIAALAGRLLDSGVGVQIGAHGQREGLGTHWEMWMLVQGGMSAHDALKVATIKGAEYLGMDNDLGSIEPGKLADLVILGADPLEDIRDTERVDYIVLGGRMYEAETMNALMPKEQRRPKLFFEP